MKLLEKLTSAYGPSGQEDEVRKIIKKEAMGISKKITEDNLGNIYVKIGSGKPIYSIFAHMDEIALLITENSNFIPKS